MNTATKDIVQQKQQVQAKVEPPKISSYLDYRAFLQDLYQYKKATDGDFSFATWAKKANIKSRSFLRLVIVGKRTLTESVLPALVRSLELEKKESLYFMTLVRFNNARDIETRQLYFNELQTYLKEQHTVIHNAYDYLSSHWCPRIHVILTLEGVDTSVVSLSKMTGLSKSKVKEVLQILQCIGNAFEKDGQWFSKDCIFEVPDELSNLAIQSFHKNSLEMGIEAIGKDPDERQFQSIFFALSEDEYQEVCKRIDSFTTNLLHEFGRKKSYNKRLYQLNENLIPMTTKFIQSDTDKKVMTEPEQVKLRGNISGETSCLQ